MSKIYSKEEQYVRMTSEPIPKVLWSLAIPSIMTQMISSLYNMADTYFVSQIGTSAAAAVGVVFSLQSLIQALGFGTSMGAQSLISIRLGEKKDQEANMVGSSAILSGFLLGFILMIIGQLTLESLMKLLGSTSTILPYSCSYARYILVGAPIMCTSYALNGILKAQGESDLAMYGMCAGGVINIVLDPIFIFRLNLGIAGAALATILSQLISLILLASMFFRGKTIIHLSTKYISRNIDDYFLIYKTGLPTICRQGLGSVSSALLNIHAAVYGDALIAAVSIANKIYMLVRNIIMGFGQALQPIAGYNYGAKKYGRVKEVFWYCTKMGTLYGCVAMLFILACSRDIITWFRADDPIVIQVGMYALRFVAAVMPFMAYSTYVNQVFQCLGKAKRATFLASLRQGIWFIPLITILPTVLEETGIMMSQPGADLLTFVTALPFQIHFFKHELKEK